MLGDPAAHEGQEPGNVVSVKRGEAIGGQVREIDQQATGALSELGAAHARIEKAQPVPAMKRRDLGSSRERESGTLHENGEPRQRL